MSKFKTFMLAAEEIAQAAAVATGGEVKKQAEDEIVFYAQITDWLGLDRAESVESHEQWEIKIQSEDPAVKKRVRVRKTTEQLSTSEGGVDFGAPKFVLTAKTKRDTGNEVTGNEEENIDVNEAMFALFRSFANSGMIKTRYVYHANAVNVKCGEQDVSLDASIIKFEVDVFPVQEEGKEGKSAWVKIDVEVNKILEGIKALGLDHAKVEFEVDVSKLPFKPTNILRQGNPEDESKIRELYDSVFLAKKPAPAA